MEKWLEASGAAMLLVASGSKVRRLCHGILNRQRANCSNCKGKGTTLVELVVTISLMVVIMGTVLPLIRHANLVWDVYEDNAETLQNGRILLDHLSRHLAETARIESVSSAGNAMGYIQFTDYDDTTYRYEVNDSGDVQYGEPNALSYLAGPISQLKFTCYNSDNISSPITDITAIRLIKIEATIIHSGERNQDMKFGTAVFINTDPATTVEFFEGWWRLDGSVGIMARDSSGYARHGTLKNMEGNEWTVGMRSGALDFNGSMDYVELPIGQLIHETKNCTISSWVNWSGMGDPDQRIFDFGKDASKYMYLTPNTSGGIMRFAMTKSGWKNEHQTSSTAALGTGWHHIAVTVDDTNSLHRLYLDGALTAQNTSANLCPKDLGETTQNWLGRSQYSTDPYFDGTLDDIRFYSRILSGQEIRNMASGLVQFKDFEEAKASTNVQSLTIPTPGSQKASNVIYSLGTWSTGLSHTAPSGMNRLLVVTAHAEDDKKDIKLEAMTYGGQVMTKIKEKRVKEGQYRGYVIAYILTEPDIANAADTNFSPIWSDIPDEVEYASVFLENVNQSDPIGDNESKEDKRKDTLSTKEVHANPGDMVLLAGTAGNTGSYSVNNGFTEGIELSITSADGVVGCQSADGTNITPSITHNDPKRQVLIGFVVQVQDERYYQPGVSIEGHLLVAVVVTDASETISEPSGEDWTLLLHETASAKATVGVWAKLAGTSESTTHTFTWGSDEQAYGWIMRFTGHDPARPIDVLDSLGGSSTRYPPSPSVTTTVNNAMIIRIGGFDGDDVNIDDTGLSGHTTITMNTSGTGNSSISGGAGYIYQSEAGSSGTDTFALTKPQEYRTITMAIAPVPSQ